MTIERGPRNLTSLALKIEGGATVQEMWEDFKGYNKQGNRLSPGAFRKVCNPANTLILAQKDPFQTSEPQNYRIANVCWVKPLKLWCNLLQQQQWPLLKNKCLGKALFVLQNRLIFFPPGEEVGRFPTFHCSLRFLHILTARPMANQELWLSAWGRCQGWGQGRCLSLTQSNCFHDILNASVFGLLGPIRWVAQRLFPGAS